MKNIFNGAVATKREQVEQSNSSNHINKGTVITGDIETFGNIRIDGRIKGDIRSQAKVALGPSAVVEGNIFAQNADIEGEVKGNIEVIELLQLHATGTIQGDISTGKLQIAAGASFNGKCQMGEANATHKRIEQDTKKATHAKTQ